MNKERYYLFFAKTEFHNKDALFGIKQGEDRRRHSYIIGKSGTGKDLSSPTWLLTTSEKAGVASSTPHGDLCDIILDYIPSSRVNDCCFFNPADPDYVYPLNVLEAQNESQKELVASGAISLFANSTAILPGDPVWNIFSVMPSCPWSIRPSDLTHGRNPDSCYRDKVVGNFQNPDSLKFFGSMNLIAWDDIQQEEAIAPDF